MKHGLLSSFIIVVLTASFSAFAAEQHQQATGQKAVQAVPLHDGVVKKLDQKKATVTLQHGDIAEVGMPAMTMSYPVKHAQELAALHPGDKVRFALEKSDGDYIVTRIEAAKP